MKTATVIKIAAAALVPAVTYVVARVSWEGSIIALEEIHPDVPQWIIRDIHMSMVMDTLSGKLEDHDMSDDDVCEAIFLDRLAGYTAPSPFDN